MRMKHMVLSFVVALVLVAGFIPQVDAGGVIGVMREILAEDDIPENPGIEIPEDNHNTALMLNFRGHLHERQVELRLQNVNFTDLMGAAAEGDTEQVILLLQEGADVNATTDGGETALDFAKKYKHEETAMVIEDYIFNTTVGPKTKSAKK
jgi:hypothetical protein